MHWRRGTRLGRGGIRRQVNASAAPPPLCLARITSNIERGSSSSARGSPLRNRDGRRPSQTSRETVTVGGGVLFRPSRVHCYESLERLIGISHKHWNHGKINGGQKRHYPFRHPKWRYPYQERCELPDPPLVITLSLFLLSSPQIHSNSNLANR